MEMKKVLNLFVALAFFNLVFLSSNAVMAKAETHHVFSKPERSTEAQTKTDEKNTTIESQARDKNIKENETKSKTTDNPISKKKLSDQQNMTNKEKPLVIKSEKELANKLPDYMKDWMIFIHKKCGSDCTLTYNDILKLIEDSNIAGQQAAVLGAIVTQMNNANSTKVQYTLKELQKMFNENKSIYSSYYKTALQNINGVRDLSGPQDKLFGPTGSLTSSTQIVQNALGDCFILSAINGLLNTPGGPLKLQNMISRIPGKTDEFIVSLPGDPKSIIVKLTDAKLAMYSNLPKGGEWLAVLSDAEARARRLNPESGIFKGGYQTQTLHLLTGTNYENRALSPFTPHQVDLVKSLSKEQWNALENLSDAQLATLNTLKFKQLQDTLTKDQIKALEKLTSDQLIELQKLTSAQWNQLGTLIYNNAGNVDLKLLNTLKPLSQEKLTKQIESDLNAALNESKPPKIVGIETNVHDLTVLAYNQKAQTLTIKNPWGVTGWYNPVTASGPNTKRPENGSTPPWFDMKNGVFNVHLSQLVESNFVTVTLPKSIVNDTTFSTSIHSMQDSIDAAKKLNPEEKEIIKVTLDKAKAAINKIKAYEDEIDATQLTCQNQGTNVECQNKLKNLSNKLENAKADAQIEIDKVAEIIDKK